MQKMFDLTGRVALVTGGNRGLGFGIAKGLAEAGADIVSIQRSGMDEEIKKVVEGLGRRYMGIQLDISELDKIYPTVDRVIEEFGRLDILVNNAGITRRYPPEDFPLEDWQVILKVNLDAVFCFCQAAGRQMLKQGKGKIINMASVLTFQGGILIPAYAAAKGAIGSLTKALANDWASKGINVNAIAPGYMVTDMTEALQRDEVRSRQILERIPANRWGKPEDLAGAVVFLASDASDYVHGHILVVDGGWLGR